MLTDTGWGCGVDESVNMFLRLRFTGTLCADRNSVSVFT
jgi:hypothetical protein